MRCALRTKTTVSRSTIVCILYSAFCVNGRKPHPPSRRAPRARSRAWAARGCVCMLGTATTKSSYDRFVSDPATSNAWVGTGRRR